MAFCGGCDLMVKMLIDFDGSKLWQRKEQFEWRKSRLLQLIWALNRAA